MEKVLQEISSNFWAIMGILLTYFSLIVPIIKYLRSRRFEFRQNTFHNYHEILKSLVQKTDGGLSIDRQVAVIFELRNFPDYYSVTERILKALRDSWDQQNNSQRLINEIDMTLTYINQGNCNLWAIIKRKICGT